MTIDEYIEVLKLGEDTLDNDNLLQLAEWLEELNAIKELDLDIPQHFTKEQSNWIKAYVILKKKEAKVDAIEEFVNEYKNFVSDEGECNLQEDCSYSGGWCIDCFNEKWMKDSKS